MLEYGNFIEQLNFSVKNQIMTEDTFVHSGSEIKAENISIDIHPTTQNGSSQNKIKINISQFATIQELINEIKKNISVNDSILEENYIVFSEKNSRLYEAKIFNGHEFELDIVDVIFKDSTK